MTATTLLIASLALSSPSDNNKTEDQNTPSIQHAMHNTAKKILIVGMNPVTINFNDPEIPKGLSPELIEKGTNATLQLLEAAGYTATKYWIDNHTTDLSGLAKQLMEQNYDCVVIGNGIRSLKSNFLLFEQIINTVHSHASGAKIVFNTLPTDTLEAVKRWL